MQTLVRGSRDELERARDRQRPGEALDVLQLGQVGEQACGEVLAEAQRELAQSILAAARRDARDRVVDQEGVGVQRLGELGLGRVGRAAPPGMLRSILVLDGVDHEVVDGEADGGHGEFVELEHVEEGCPEN